MWNPFRQSTYTKGQPVWCISKEHGAMQGTISDVLHDGYIVHIPSLIGKTNDYWVLKSDTNQRLRAREEITR